MSLSFADHLAYGADVLAAGILTGRAEGAFFALHGDGLYASPLGCVVLSAGLLSRDEVIALYDDERDRYARRVLAKFDGDQKAIVIRLSVYDGLHPIDIAKILLGKLDIFLDSGLAPAKINA